MTPLSDKTPSELLDMLPAGPWQWRGRYDDVYLCTKYCGWRFLLGAARCGMHGAQFSFVSQGPMLRGHNDGLYLPRAPHDQKTIVDINHPLAELIRRIPELVAKIAELETQLEARARS